ncbi:MAG TPA: hypothetical protein VJU54_08695 [Nitrospiraceae bacterium]|nr:hypothetical protein [Nitrospiraceae bacterium]
MQKSSIKECRYALQTSIFSLAGYVWYHVTDGRVSRITLNFPDTIDLNLSANWRQTGNPAMVDDFVRLAMASHRFKQGRA